MAIPLLGPQRTQWQYPFRSLAATGAGIAAGSDWPVSSPDPIQGMHVAVNRVAPGGQDEPLVPEERLALSAALSAYTAGTARINHADQTGRVADGLRADLVLLDRDPFAGPPEEIHQARVAATFVDGREVFRA